MPVLRCCAATLAVNAMPLQCQGYMSTLILLADQEKHQMQQHPP